MKTNAVIILIAISSLLLLAKADSIATTTGDPLQLQLMDLTELLKQLNVTYQDLAMNLSTLNSLNNLPSPSQLDPNYYNSSEQQGSTGTKSTVDTPIPSQSTPQDSKTDSKPKAAPSVSNTSASTPQKVVDSPATTKSPPSSAQDTKPTKNIQPASTTSTSSSVSATTSPATSSSNSPTFGPGPNNKSLPPVIDLTKMTVVDITAPASKPSTPSSTSNTNTKTTSTSTQTTTQDNTAPSTKDTSTSAVKTSSNNIVNNINSNAPTQSSSTTQSSPTVPPSTTSTKTQTATVSTQTNVQPTSYTPKNTQTPKNVPVVQTTDKNSVYLAPISANTKPTSDTTKSNNQNQQTNQPQSPISTPTPSTSSSPSAQGWNSDASTLYNLTTAYKSFSPYFIITKNDPYLPQLRTFLLNNYGNYLSQGQIIAGFRLYNNNGDNSLDYQLLFSTFYGTFTTILTYWPDTNRIMLKTLSILNFYIMEIDYSNCQTQDLLQQNCRVCNDGYRNFMGRCRAFDPFCGKYLSDQCGACSQGRRLFNGQCQ